MEEHSKYWGGVRDGAGRKPNGKGKKWAKIELTPDLLTMINDIYYASGNTTEEKIISALRYLYGLEKYRGMLASQKGTIHDGNPEKE